jgi:uncharacterized protein YndB with AHSA1/START domain/uncharacterized protein YciI
MVFMSLSTSLSAQEGDTMQIPKPLHYFVELHGTREGWPEDMIAAEEKIMEEHFVYLRDLTAKGKVLMAGPVLGKFGMIVLSVYSEEEARQIMAEEPSVKNGIHTYTLTAMRASLMANTVPPFRYAVTDSSRVLHKEVEVDASLAKVWEAWTTTAGVKTFFSSDATVDLRVGGPFEIYFLDENPYGSKGSEDCKILSFLPMKLLSFEWNAPLQFGKLRDKRTQVIIFFDEIKPGKVKVDFSQHGWGTGNDWDKLYEYFDKAWSYVLGNLQKRFAEGPINWDE